MIRKKGRLIVFEGSDGSGKATQTRLLRKFYKKRKVSCELISFPMHDSTWGRVIKRYLAGEYGNVMQVDPYLASVLYAGDRLLFSEKMKKWLEMGKVVICDRYTASNVAHQAAKINVKNSRDKYIKWIEDFEYRQNNIPKEDLTIYLSVPNKKSQELMKNRKKDIHEKDKKYLFKVSKIYQELAKKNKDWQIVDCFENGKLLSRVAIHKKIVEIVS